MHQARPCKNQTQERSFSSMQAKVSLGTLVEKRRGVKKKETTPKEGVAFKKCFYQSLGSSGALGVMVQLLPWHLKPASKNTALLKPPFLAFICASIARPPAAQWKMI